MISEGYPPVDPVLTLSVNVLVAAARGERGVGGVAIDLADAVLRVAAVPSAVDVLVAAANRDATTVARGIRLAEEMLRAGEAADVEWDQLVGCVSQLLFAPLSFCGVPLGPGAECRGRPGEAAPALGGPVRG